MIPRPVIAIVGVGGLGCPAAWSLARSGLGIELRLVDEDRVERSNLHRQTLFTESDVGSLKVDAAARSVMSAGGDVTVDPRPVHIAPELALSLLEGVSVVVEGTDNLPTKFLVSDVARDLGIPVVHGACIGWTGTVLPVVPGESACYRCVFESLPMEAEAPACSTAGVYGPVTTVVGALMAADALRLLRGDRSTAGSFAVYEARSQRFRCTRFNRRARCEGCGAAPRYSLVSRTPVPSRSPGT